MRGEGWAVVFIGSVGEDSLFASGNDITGGNGRKAADADAGGEFELPFGKTVVLGISFPVFSPGGTTDEDTESKDDRYRSADAGSLLSFLVEKASRDFDWDDADGETEAFGADTVAVGATGEACWAGGDTAGWGETEAFCADTVAVGATGEACWAGGDTTGWVLVSFSSSVNRLSVGPGPSPTSILEKSFICDLVEAHPPPKTKAPATTRTVQATAHMDFTIPPCKRLTV